MVLKIGNLSLKIDWKLEIGNLLFILILWRLLLFLPLFFGKNIPYRPKYEYTQIFCSTPEYQPVNSPLLFPWANFDGVHYLDIAGNGYKDNGRFFPILPLLIRGIATFFGTGAAFGAVQFFSGLFLTNISFFLAIIFLYKLLRLDFSKEVSFWTIIFLIAFPTSFFFGAIYSESVFLLLLVLSFYNARKQHFFLASLMALLLSITRPIGLLIIPALLYELYLQKKSIKNYLLPITCYLLLIPTGLIFYSLYSYFKWHDPLFFLHAQAMLQNGRTVTGFIFPLQTVWRYIKILMTVSRRQFEWYIALLELGSFLFAGCLLLASWFKKIRPSYLIFSILAFLVPVVSGTFSGLPRYVLVLFPIFIALAQIKNKWLKIGYIALGLILQFVLLLFFSRGFFIA